MTTITSPFPAIGTLISNINLFDAGMFIAFAMLALGLARMMTKDSKHLPVILTTFLSFMAIITIIDLKIGVQLAISAAIGTMMWFIPMFKSSTKGDLKEE